MVLIPLAALGGLVFSRFNAVRPAAGWLSLHVLSAAAWTCWFALACLAVGATALRWLTRGPRRDGHWAFAFALGALGFALAIAGLGFAHLLSPVVLWLLPFSLLFAFRRALLEDLVKSLQKAPAPVSAPELFWLALGVVGLFLALLPLSNPENVNYDARWYHLAFAERFAVMGAITPSPDATLLYAGPQLSSWLYTWPFLDLDAPLFDKVMRATFIEAACFLFTLAAIPALARALSPSPSLSPGASRWAWVALLLFPSLYIYDTGLMGAADHVAAMFAPVILLAWLQAIERDDAHSWVLLGLLAGGLALTKYTAIILLAPVALAFTVERLWRRRWLHPALALVTIAAITTPYWLRNWIWYGDPVYPLAARFFSPHPWVADAPAWLSRLSFELFVPTDGTWHYRVTETLKALWNYHLELYTWEDVVSSTPVFGSLYALSMGVLPFLKNTRRLWALALIVHLGIALWFNLSHQMRFLIVFVPLMAAAVACVFAQAWSWRSGWVRAGLLGALALQLICAGDVAFLPTSRVNGRQSPIGAAASLIGRSSESNLERLRVFSAWSGFGAQVPPEATVLVHGSWTWLGFGHPIVTDTPGIQFGLSYRQLGSVEAMRQHLLQLGVSWVGWTPVTGEPNSVTDELLFRSFTRLAAGQPRVIGGWLFAPIATQSNAPPSGGVLYLGCRDSYPTGLYQLGDLSVPVPPAMALPPVWPAPRETRADPLMLLEKAGYVVTEEGCSFDKSFPGFRPLGSNADSGVTRNYFLKG